MLAQSRVGALLPPEWLYLPNRNRYTRGIDSRVLAHVLRPPIAAVFPACDIQREYVKAQWLARAA